MFYLAGRTVLYTAVNCMDGSKVWIASKCASVGVAGLGSFFHHRSNPTMEYFTFVE